MTIKNKNLREDKRRQVMRRVQAAALDLFEARGFAAVTIEAIAARAEVGPATVYRHFGTKEGIVLWDDYDPMFLQLVGERLRAGAAPLAAMREAVIAGLDVFYKHDAARIVRRQRLIARVPALAAAAAAGQAELRRALAAALRRACRDALCAAVIAGAAMAAIEAAAEQWLRGGGRVALRHYVVRAFASLGALGSTK